MTHLLWTTGSARRCGATLTTLTHALDYPAHPPLDEATARAHAAELRALAAAHGITNLRFASTGRLLGHLEPDRDIRISEPWARLYQRRNRLAHEPLDDIDDDAVWRVTTVRTARYRQQARALLR
ncbi:MAG TPA: hypothetical protein VHX59_25875 [Mycobacteriales bacterium]|jgi:hypothetical protein|nr:hypothetical protein [Mycobacteriales bacterium]